MAEETVPTPQPHDRSRPDPDDEEDPVDNMIKQTGCLELHYAVQECMAENRDWRKCQDQVAAFKKCITDSALLSAAKRTKPASTVSEESS